MRVHLTDEGRERLQAMRAARTALLEQRLNDFTADERAALAAALPAAGPIDGRGRMSIKDQPKAVWAVAFACVIAFMGIGLVDPILPVLAQDLDATPSQVSLLFTSYFAITGVSMLVTGYVSSRIGPRKTLLGGLILVILFAALAGASGSIPEIVGFRAGWGLGNALFIATALARDHRLGVRRRRRARSSSTRPRSASASPPARCSAASSAGSPGAARSSAPRR